MILLAGIADESPMALVIEALEAIGAEYRVFDQRRAASATMTLIVPEEGGATGGALTLDGDSIPLRNIRGLYLRMMDDRLLPEVESLAPDAAMRIHYRRLHDLVLRFADIATGRVLNRPIDMGSNHSKPFQAQHIRQAGFDIPETLITNDPPSARDFIERVWQEGGGVIYKSVSGVRSIVQAVDRQSLERLDRIRWCPTQFQRQIAGTDIRVHVIGHTALGTTIVSDAADYRYASRQTGIEPTLIPAELDAVVRHRCIRLAERLALPLAGIDLRRTPEGRFVCFEVNPSPAFSYYEQRTGVSIASCIARYLTGESD